VSSALETSVGLSAGVALAAALPQLEYAAGLATVGMLADDVADHRLAAVDGYVPVLRPEVSEEHLDRVAAAPDREAHWRARLAEVRALRKDRGS
jgi:O-succinylbenzoate synthase